MVAWHVTRLRVQSGLRLEVEFADGLRGVVNMSGANFSGIFGSLADEAYLRLASIRNGVVVWPNGVDFAPDVTHAEVSGNRTEASR